MFEVGKNITFTALTLIYIFFLDNAYLLFVSGYLYKALGVLKIQSLLFGCMDEIIRSSKKEQGIRSQGILCCIPVC